MPEPLDGPVHRRQPLDVATRESFGLVTLALALLIRESPALGGEPGGVSLDVREPVRRRVHGCRSWRTSKRRPGLHTPTELSAGSGIVGISRQSGEHRSNLPERQRVALQQSPAGDPFGVRGRESCPKRFPIPMRVCGAKPLVGFS
jgi:hypothetical protein